VVKQHSLKEIVHKVRELGLCTMIPPIQDVEKTLYLPNEDLEALPNFLRSILEPTRFKILYLLHQSPLPTCIIAYVLEQDRTLISHHLAKLMELNLVEVKQARHFNIYNLTEHGITIVDKILELFKEVNSSETLKIKYRSEKRRIKNANAQQVN